MPGKVPEDTEVGRGEVVVDLRQGMSSDWLTKTLRRLQRTGKLVKEVNII